MTKCGGPSPLARLARGGAEGSPCDKSDLPLPPSVLLARCDINHKGVATHPKLRLVRLPPPRDSAATAAARHGRVNRDRGDDGDDGGDGGDGAALAGARIA